MRAAKSVRKSGTATTKKHRFQTFSERVAKFNVDPVRRNQGRAWTHQQDESSHFSSAFLDWKELNLSEGFAAFVQQVQPLCHSLPQILHNEQKIVDILLEHIEKQVVLSLEPLLSLVVHLARDLGVKFEAHFQRVVETVSRVAAKHENIEAIEWSFTCLAWLFKYLSRLLVPDLRPLYKLMSPLFGKMRQKDFVTTFAAEAMSFLIRKAAAAYAKTPNSLLMIVKYIFNDLAATPHDQVEQYQHGLGVLFTTAMKGIQRRTHSQADTIYAVLLSQLLNDANVEASDTNKIQWVVEYVLGEILQHTDAEGFAAILDTHLAATRPMYKSGSNRNLTITLKLTLLIAGTRRGNKIYDWTLVLDRLIEYLELEDILSSDITPETGLLLTQTLAAAVQCAPLDKLLPSSTTIMAQFAHDAWAPYFLQFCIAVFELDSGRFHDLIYADLWQFVSIRWNEYETQICFTLLKLGAQSAWSDSKTQVPIQARENIIQWFRVLAGRVSDRPANVQSEDDTLSLMSHCNCFLEVMRIFPHSDLHDTVADLLLPVLDSALATENHQPEPVVSFAVTMVLQFLAENLRVEEGRQRLLFIFFRAADQHSRRTTFLKAFLALLRRMPSKPSGDELSSSAMTAKLVKNLASSSHDLRLLSLEILQALHPLNGKEQSPGLDAAITLESSPFDFENARLASMAVRQLAAIFEEPATDTLTRQTLSTYCFGLLHVRLAAVWDDACTALRLMSNHKGFGEQIVERAVKWLEDAADHSPLNEPDSTTKPSPTGPAPYYDANVLGVEHLTSQIAHDFDHVQQRLEERLHQVTSSEDLSHPSNRSQGLRVLKAVPAWAERRSRALVPVILAWSPPEAFMANEDAPPISHAHSPEEEVISTDLSTTSWTRADQKALLGIFSSFTNPRVLYRSVDVYQALLGLLGHGDSEVQKAALQALMTWDQDSIKTYKDHLLNLLDDARFRDEVAVFLNVEEGESEIQPDHRLLLMPVLLRLLYGRVVSQTGSTSTRGTQKSKRRAVITALARFGDKELGDFLAVALGPLSTLPPMIGPELQRCRVETERLSPRKQIGMLRLLRDVVQILARRVSPFAPLLLNAILYCLLRASQPSVEPKTDDVDGKNNEGVGLSLFRECRQEGIGALGVLFEACPDFDWNRYTTTIIENVVNPRLEKLPIETAQSISGIHRLFATWASSSSTVALLFNANPLLLTRVSECLAEPSGREEVKFFVMKSIMEPILGFIPAHDAPSSNLLSQTERVVDVALRNDLGQTMAKNVIVFVRQHPTKEVLDRAVEVLPNLAPYVTAKPDIHALITISLFMLQQPPKLASPRLKGRVLAVLQKVLSRLDSGVDTKLFSDIYDTLCTLFSYFKDNQNRHMLVSVFSSLGSSNGDTSEVAKLCEQLNASSSGRLDQPDFTTRLRAMQIIADGAKGLSVNQWTPLLHNMLFLIRDDDELSMRSSASLCLRKFVQQACNGLGTHQRLMDEGLLPAIERGMSEPSELIRTEYVSVLSEMISCSWPPVADMACLEGPEDEASFFRNILHIQNHRRLRALRRLASDAPSISSLNIARFCLPLTENFFVDSDEGDQNLANEALVTLEAMALSLEWHRYRSLLQRTAAKASKMESKFHIRTFGAVVNALYHVHTTSTLRPVAIDSEHDIEKEHRPTSNLAKSLPAPDALAKSLMQVALSKLMEIVHYKDETTVDLRVMLAPMAVKLLLILPKQQIDSNLPTILMDVCNILRSKSQEARDMARKVLSDIAALIGSNYFGFIVKQLKTSLQRGSQLHVLSYTIHSILVAVGPTFTAGEIDYCLPELMEIIVNDIFGSVGQEKEAAEYISRMKEVKKKSLSFDSVEILASIATLGQVSVMLEPIMEQLTKSRPKISHADELLRRIREGLRRNGGTKSQDSLTLSFQLLQEAYKGTSQGQLQSSLAACKMAAFALELLRRILDKYEDYKTPERLAGFVPMLRRSIEQEDEEVQIAAMRLVTSIINVPIVEFDENAKLYVRIARNLVDASPSTKTPVAQAAVRMLSVVLRERPNAQIPKSDFDNNIAYLLRRMKPDLQTPGRQGEREQQIAAFNFLRAVVGRKEPIAEIYDIMDVVREIMISGAEPPVPDLARSVYSRFVLEYFPGEMKGFSKQLDFLVANLQYPHSRGRLSTMEVVMFILLHKNDTAVQDILVVFYLPLVVALATDSEQECRDSAAMLIRKIFERADKERIKTFKIQMDKWLDADTDALWKQAALQCWTLYFDIHTTSTKDAVTARGYVDRLLHVSSDEASEGDVQLLPGVLLLFQKLCDKFPATALASASDSCWSSITRHIRNQSGEVRPVVASLINLYMTDFLRAASKVTTPKNFPLTGSYGLELDVVRASSIAKSTMRMMQSETIDSLVDQATQNAALISRLSIEAHSDKLLTDVFSEAAAVVRMEGTGQPPKAKVAATKLLLALTSMAAAEKIVPSLQDILLPLSNLMDTAVPTAASSDPQFNAVQEELLARAQELLEAIQKKMGSTTYIASMQAVQKAVRERREERRVKRRIDAISAPERVEKKRHKKHETQKTKRREKNTLAAGQRRGW